MINVLNKLSKLTEQDFLFITTVSDNCCKEVAI